MNQIQYFRWWKYLLKMTWMNRNRFCSNNITHWVRTFPDREKRLIRMAIESGEIGCFSIDLTTEMALQIVNSLQCDISSIIEEQGDAL